MFINCGMYAFTKSLRQKWIEIFQQAIPFLLKPYNQGLEIRFDSNHDSYLSPELLIGHTCGYPYITNWYRTHDLICVPIFEIDGCQGLEYSSWFVTHKSSDIQSIEDCHNKIAVINSHDSNSGMNVLRYEVSKFARGKPFFDKVLVSGSHIASMEGLVQGNADIAAIDAVTYHFARETNAFDTSQLKIIGQSQSSSGLPFIKHKGLQIEPSVIVDALNTALALIPDKTKNNLYINKFSLVSHVDYESIQQLEMESKKNRYPILH